MARIYSLNPSQPINLELNKERIRIGRLPDNDIVINDVLVSRRHCEIVKEQGRWKIIDLESLNGTYVNNLRIKEEYLASGDVIVVGNIQLVFEDRLPEIHSPQKIFEQELIRPVQEIENELGLQSQLKKEELKPDESAHFYILYQFARALNSATSLNELLDLSLELVFQVINAERGVIFLLDEKGQLKLSSARTREKGKVDELDIPVSSTIAQKVIEEKAGIITNDAKYDPRFQAGESIIAYNIRSAICAPIWEKSEVRGVIYLDNLLQTYAFSEDDLRLLSAIAHHLAIALREEELKARMREEAVFRSHLARFHSPEVVNLIFEQVRKGEELSQQISEREVTILFADICGFTRLCEKIAPEELAGLLNNYFDQMSKIIFKYKGTVDKFIGDAIMAVFGAPISYGNDAELAIYAGLEMMEEMKKLREKLEQRMRFQIRIGINTGVVVAGYIGSSQRLEYTVLGDPVNVASRLQELALPGTIYIGETTYERVKGLFRVKEIGSIRLRGKEQEIKTYQVLEATKDSELISHLEPPEI